MPQQPISIDTWLKTRSPFLTKEEFLASRSRYMTQQEFASRGLEASKEKEEERRDILHDIGNVIESFAYKGLNELSFGLAHPPETFKPESMAAEVAGQIGGFAGLVVGPGKAIKIPQKIAGKYLARTIPRVLARTTSRVAGKAAFRPAYGAGRLVAHATNEIAGMAALGAVKDLNATEPEFIENVKGFGIMGGVFGAAKMLDVPKNPVLGWVLRQAGVRAIMAATQQYPEGYLTKENLPNIVWQEAMNTVFVRHGITPGEIISGKYSDGRKANIVKSMERAIKQIDANRAKEAKLKIERGTGAISIAKEFFAKPVRERVLFRDIDIDESKVNPDVVRNIKDQMEARKSDKGKYKEPRIDLTYDPQTKRYNAGEDYNSALKAIKDINMQRARSGEQMIDDVGAYIKEGGNYRKTRLSTPMDLAYRLLGFDSMQQKVVEHFQDADTIVLQVTAKSNGKLKAIYKGSVNDANRKLEPGEVIFRFSDGDMVPIAVADDLKDTIVWKGWKIPTKDVYDKIKDIEPAIKDYERILAENPTPEQVADITPKLEDLKLQKANLIDVLKSDIVDTKFKVNVSKKVKKSVTVPEEPAAKTTEELSAIVAEQKKKVEEIIGRELEDSPEERMTIPNARAEALGIPQTGEKMYDDIINNGSDKYDFVIVKMSPDEFLQKRKDAGAERRIDPDAVEIIKAKRKVGVNIDAPLIDYTKSLASRGKDAPDKPAFDGSHRVVAAKEMGDKEITVVEFYKKGQVPKNRGEGVNDKGVWARHGTQNDYYNSPYRKQIEEAMARNDTEAIHELMAKENMWELDRVSKGEKKAGLFNVEDDPKLKEEIKKRADLPEDGETTFQELQRIGLGRKVVEELGNTLGLKTKPTSVEFNLFIDELVTKINSMSGKDVRDAILKAEKSVYELERKSRGYNNTDVKDLELEISEREKAKALSDATRYDLLAKVYRDGDVILVAKKQADLDSLEAAFKTGTARDLGLALGYKDLWAKENSQVKVIEEYVQRAASVPRAVLVKATGKAYPIRKGEQIHPDIINRLLKEGIIKDVDEIEIGWVAPDGSYTPNMIVGQYGYSKYDNANDLIGSIKARARHGNDAASIAKGLDMPEGLVKKVMDDAPDAVKSIEEYTATASMRGPQKPKFESVRDAADSIRAMAKKGSTDSVEISKSLDIPEDIVNLVLSKDRSSSAAISKWLKETAAAAEAAPKIKVIGKPYIEKPKPAKPPKPPKPEKKKVEKVYVEEEVAEEVEGDFGKMHQRAREIYETVKAMPETPLPASHQLYLKMRFDEAAVGASDISTLYRSLGIGREGPKLKDLSAIEERLRALEDAPLEARVNILLKDYYTQFKHIAWTPLTGESKARQEASEIAMMQRVHRNFMKAIADYKADQTDKSPIARVLTRRIAGSWLDVRYQMMKAEEESGHPFFRIYRWASEGEHRKKWEHSIRMKKINSFWDAKPEDQAAVRNYFNRMYKNQDPPQVIEDGKTIPNEKSYNVLTKYQKKYVDAINEMMHEMREPIFDYRFKIWMEEVRKPRLLDLQKADISLDAKAKELRDKKYTRVFRSQDSKVIREMLEQAAEAYELRGPEDPRFKQLKATLMDKFSLGLVQEGAYLPEIFEGVGKSGLGDRDILLNIDLLGKSHFHERIKLSNGEEINISDMLLKQHRAETNLAKQLENYANQVLNVKYLSEPLGALDTLADMFYKDYNDAKPNAFGRPTPEARAYSFYGYLNLYATRLKGFPVKVGGFGSALKGIQSVFFRSLTVRPMLIIRNFPQRIVTAVNKSFVLDPRYINAKFKNLSPEVQEWFDSFGTNELEMVKNEWLSLTTDYKWSKYPVIGHVWKAAARVGNLYALSDVSNRRFVFSRTWFKTRDAIKDFRAGRISQEKMERISHIERQRPLEQREFREQIELGNDDMAANINARFQTVNSQWYYGRTERSFAEMTPEGETYSNLITWSKSMAQQTYNSAERMVDGYQRYKLLKAEGKNKLANEALRQSMNGTSQIAGVFLTGAVANALLNTLSLNHKGKYQSYGFDMFTWEFGGVTAEMMTQFTSAIGGVVGAFEGTPQEQKSALDVVLKLADNQGIRQMFPFAKSFLSVVESITGRSYISPLSEFFSQYEYGYPKGITYVDRTFLERFMHGIMASDPSKSEDVRRFTWEHLNELKREYVMTDNPVKKAWVGHMVERYEYYNDLFQRYTPYEVFNQRDKYELENYAETYERELQNYEYNMMKKGRK